MEAGFASRDACLEAVTLGVVGSFFEVGTYGSTRGGGRAEEAIGLAADDEEESSREGASSNVTVLVKVMGAIIGLRCERW